MENLSLFDDVTQVEESFDIASARPHLDVVKMDFIEAESLTWQELFEGFDTLHAITYSSGIGFVYQLLEKFSDAEIIFGCDEVISYSLQEIMAYQCKTIERMKDTAGKMKLDLVSRIDAGSLRFLSQNPRCLTRQFTYSLQKMVVSALLWAPQICPLPHLPAVSGKISATWIVSAHMTGTYASQKINRKHKIQVRLTVIIAHIQIHFN